MAQFGQIASPFANVLFDPIGVSMAADRTQRNRLMAEEHGQDRETEQVGRVSASLMSLPAAARPAAYAEARREMQSRGMAMRAPEQYPGDQQIEQMARAAMPAATQFALAEKQRASEAMMGMLRNLPGMGGSQGSGAMPSATQSGNVQGAGAAVPPDMLPHFQAASARTGIPVPVLTAQAQQESGFRPDAVGRAGEVGVMQVLPTTARQPGFGMQGVDPATLRDPATNIQFGADYLRARGGAGADFTDPAQRDRALTAYNGGGDPNYAANVTRNMPGGGQPAAAGGYTPEQQAALFMAARQNPSAVAGHIATFASQNRSEAERQRDNARADRGQAQSLELSRAAADRAEAAGRRQDAAAQTTAEAARQTAETARRRETTTDTIPDPANPGAVTFRPGGRHDPAVIAREAQARGEGRGGRVIPGAERTKLVEASTQIGEIDSLNATFKPEYGGYVAGAVGRAANTVERNTTGGPRSDWWQRYDRQKNIIRNELFGATLTVGEQAAFEAADITPGMAPGAIRTNLARQAEIIGTAQKRRVRSMAADGYNTRALEEASGVQLGDSAPASPGDTPPNPGPAAARPASPRLRFNPATGKIE